MAQVIPSGFICQHYFGGSFIFYKLILTMRMMGRCVAESGLCWGCKVAQHLPVGFGKPPLRYAQVRQEMIIGVGSYGPAVVAQGNGI